MFKFFIIILTFLSLNIVAQTKSGIVKYNLILGFDEGFSKSEALKTGYNLAVAGAKNITLSLVFNEKESLFKIDNIMEGVAEEIAFAKSYTSCDDIIYNSKFEPETLTQIDGFLGQFVVSETQKTDWTLTSETKDIDGYSCLKATATLVVVNSRGEFKYPITAWYCPKIAISLGPKGYTGLPGLILELQERNVTYGLKSIIFSKEPMNINKPNKGKKVSRKEFGEFIKQGYKPRD